MDEKRVGERGVAGVPGWLEFLAVALLLYRLNRIPLPLLGYQHTIYIVYN